MREAFVWVLAVVGSLVVLYAIVTIAVVLRIRASVRDWWG